MRGERTIVIAGAGVVGLAMAAVLATGRCADSLRIVVLDGRPLPRWRADQLDPRVYALSRASQRLLATLGAWAPVVQARAAPYRRMRVWEGDDAYAPGALEFDCADIGEPDLGHIVEDSLLRTALRDVLATLSNVDLMLGAPIAAVAVQPTEVEVQLDTGGAVRGTLLVGADGSDSAVRRLLALPVAARDYGQTAVVTHVSTVAPHQDTAWQRFLPGGPLAFLPLGDGRSSIVWSVPTEDAARLLAAHDTEFLAELTAAGARVLGECTACTPRIGFALRGLHARRYSAERVVLCGDAAHTVHPLAGQGVNLGLLDAAALAATVEDALLAGEDTGDLKVLKRYERRRKGANLAMLTAFSGLNSLFRLPPWAAPVRTAGLKAVAGAVPLKGFLMRQALGLRSAS